MSECLTSQVQHSTVSADELHLAYAARMVRVFVVIVQLPQLLQVLSVVLVHHLLALLAEDVALVLGHLRNGRTPAG